MNEGFLPELVPACRSSACGCDIADLMELIQNVLTWSVYLATLLLVLLLVYVGFLYVTNPTNPSNRTKAKGVAISAVIGFVVVLGAFLIVNTVIDTFAKDEFGEWKTFFGAEKSECIQVNYTPTEPPRIVGGEQSATATNINIICSAASAHGLRAIYEVQDAGLRSALQQEGVRCPILVLPSITANHFSLYGPQGCQPEVDEVSCPDCTTVNSVDFKDGQMVANDYAARLRGFAGTVESFKVQEDAEFDWWVTEAWRPTVTHQCGCHNNGTCTDINFR